MASLREKLGAIGLRAAKEAQLDPRRMTLEDYASLPEHKHLSAKQIKDKYYTEGLAESAGEGLQTTGMASAGALGYLGGRYTLGFADLAIDKVTKAQAERSLMREINAQDAAVVQKDGDIWTIKSSNGKVQKWDLSKRLQHESSLGELAVMGADKVGRRLFNAGVEYTPEMQTAEDLAGWIGLHKQIAKGTSKAVGSKGFVQAASKAVGPRIGRGLVRPLGMGAAFSGTEFIQQLENKFTKEEPLDLKEVGLLGGLGAGFGLLGNTLDWFKSRHMVSKLMAERPDVIKSLKPGEVRTVVEGREAAERGVKAVFNKHDLKTMADARIALQNTKVAKDFALSQEAWNATYGQDMLKIQEKMVNAAKKTGWDPQVLDIRKALTDYANKSAVADTFGKVKKGQFKPKEAGLTFKQTTAPDGSYVLEHYSRSAPEAFASSQKPIHLAPNTMSFWKPERVDQDAEWKDLWRAPPGGLLGGNKGAVLRSKVKSTDIYQVGSNKNDELENLFLDYRYVLADYATLDRTAATTEEKERFTKIKNALHKNGYVGFAYPERTHPDYGEFMLSDVGANEIVVPDPTKLPNMTLTPAEQWKKESPIFTVRDRTLVTPQEKQHLLPPAFFEPTKRPPKVKAPTDIDKYKRPFIGQELGVDKYITPKWMVNRLQGVEPLAAFVNKSLKMLGVRSRAGDAIARAILNRPGERVSKMYDMLDQYEDPPDFLNAKEKKVFMMLRLDTKGTLALENQARVRNGLPPIEGIKNYVTHTIDATTQDVIGATHRPSLKSDYLRTVMAGLPKNLPSNPSERERLVKKHIEGLFSRDPRRAFQAMHARAARDVYLEDAYRAAWDEAEKLRDAGLMSDDIFNDLTTYINRDILGKTAQIDKELDRTLNALLEKQPLKAMQSLLALTNRQLTQPTKQIGNALNSLIVHNALMGRVKFGTRNLGQRLLLTDLYYNDDIASAQAMQLVGKWPEVGDTDLLGQLERDPFWQATQRQTHEVEQGMLKSLAKPLMIFQSSSHKSNMGISARVGYFDWLRKFKASQNPDSKYYKEVEKAADLDVKMEADLAAEQWAVQQRNKVFNKGFRLANKIKDPAAKEKAIQNLKRNADKIYAKELKNYDKNEFIKQNREEILNNLLVDETDLMPMVREAIQLTQWEYLAQSMPWWYHSVSQKTATTLGSWQMNYYGAHMREVVHRMLTGRASSGKVLYPGRSPETAGVGVNDGFRPSQRTKTAVSIPVTWSLLTLMGMYSGVETARYFLPVFGFETGPIPDILAGMTLYVRGKVERDEMAEAEGKRRLKHGLMLLPPGYGLYRELKEFSQGKKTLKEEVVPVTPEERERLRQ
jgi:hypothetical protein